MPIALSEILCQFLPSCLTMDASTLASAALAIAVDNAEPAAMQELLREREVLAMEKEDLLTRMRERCYLPDVAGGTFAPMTWQEAFMLQRNQLNNLTDDVTRLTSDLDGILSVALTLRRGLDQVADNMAVTTNVSQSTVRYMRQVSDMISGLILNEEPRGRSRSPRR